MRPSEHRIHALIRLTRGALDAITISMGRLSTSSGEAPAWCLMESARFLEGTPSARTASARFRWYRLLGSNQGPPDPHLVLVIRKSPSVQCVRRNFCRLVNSLLKVTWFVGATLNNVEVSVQA